MFVFWIFCRFVCWSFLYDFLKRRGKLHFPGPIGTTHSVEFSRLINISLSALQSKSSVPGGVSHSLAILNKLKDEMRNLREIKQSIVPIGKFQPPAGVSATGLQTDVLELWWGNDWIGDCTTTHGLVAALVVVLGGNLVVAYSQSRNYPTSVVLRRKKNSWPLNLGQAYWGPAFMFWTWSTYVKGIV